jgi:hypothetical protein
MATSNIEVVELGIPGPPGSGVSSAEKNSYATKSGANVFTETQEIDKDGTALRVRKADGTTNKLVFSTTQFTDGLWELRNAVDMKLSSDDGTTQQVYINGGDGSANFAGAVTTTRVVGDTSIWSVVIDGGGSTITTGVKFDLEVPYNATITAWDIFADQTGSIVVDIWQDTYANFPPTVADTLSASEKPTLSSASKNQDTSLNSGSGWAVTQGRILRFNVTSVTTVQRVTVCLKVTRT